MAAMGRNYPETIDIEGRPYRRERVLKEDFFSVNVLYRHGEDRYVLKLSDFRFIGGWLLRPLAMWMSRHEYRIYRRLEGIPGIPRLGPRCTSRGYLHHFIPGRTLAELTALPPAQRRLALPEDFFERLRRTLDEIHRRRVFYADLDKRGNIILGEDGRPYLIDFQISLRFPPAGSWLGRRLEPLFRTLKGEDIYHLYKQKRRFLPDSLTEEERRLARRTDFSRRFNRFFGDRYRRLKRLLYPKGSNDLVWWKARRRTREETLQPPHD